MTRWLTAAGAWALTIAPALAQTSPASNPPVVWRHGWGMGGMMFGGGPLMLLFWGGIIVLAVFVVRWLGGAGPRDMRQPPRPRALEILDERYARGEIDKAEYDDRRRTLTAA